MRRLFAVAMIFTSGLLLGLYLRSGSPTALAGGGGAPACSAQNGDVNASGAVDLSDAVTILNFLFLGSPTELVPLCDPPELTARIQELEAQLASSQESLATCQDELNTSTTRIQELEAQLADTQDLLEGCLAANSRLGLPDTGQTQCFSCEGASRCDILLPAGSPLFGQDSRVNTGCPNDASRFTDNGDGTVTDNCTRLMWQKVTADTSGNGSLSIPEDLVTWCGALAYCIQLSLAGHDDWRLPNVRELQSIVDYGRFTPATDPIFGGLPTAAHWSSTSWPASPNLAWKIENGIGSADAVDKDNALAVRAVRNAP